VEFVQKNEAMFRDLNITDRELEVIGLLVQGVPNATISSTLVVTESTTKRHVYNIFRKLKISNRFELMKWMNERVVEGLG
jgi:LuxR family transcriptional regulator, positive regulator of biofilm formation